MIAEDVELTTNNISFFHTRCSTRKAVADFLRINRYLIIAKASIQQDIAWVFTLVCNWYTLFDVSCIQ